MVVYLFNKKEITFTLVDKLYMEIENIVTCNFLMKNYVLGFAIWLMSNSLSGQGFGGMQFYP